MPHLDPATWVFSIAIFSAALTALSASYCYSIRGRDVGMADWAKACAFLALAKYTYSMRAEWPELASVYLPNVLILPAIVFMWSAHTRLFGKTPDFRLAGCLLVVAMLAFGFCLASGAPPRYVAMVGSMFSGTLLLRTVVMIMAHTEWRASPSTWVSLVTLSLAGVVVLARALGIAAGWSQVGDLYSGTWVSNATLLVFALANLGFSLGFFVLVNERLRQELTELSCRDGLSGLLTRTAFQAGSEAMARETDEHGYAIIMLDLDHFKKINDTWGHLAGDAIIRQTASCLVRAVRPGDLVGRYGGEEFCLMLQRCSMADARERSEALVARIAAEPMRLPDGQPVVVTASAGLAWQAVSSPLQVGAHGSPVVERLFDLADQALYAAKRAGRNRVVMA